MKKQTIFQKLDAMLRGGVQYGEGVDDALRVICRSLTAEEFIVWFSGMDERSPLFRQHVHEMVEKVSRDVGESAPDNQEQMRVAFRIHFSTEDACYFQYHVFPPTHLQYVKEWARKRDGASQVVLLTISDRLYIQMFLEECRANPHVSRVDPISEAEFIAAPSNSVD